MDENSVFREPHGPKSKPPVCMETVEDVGRHYGRAIVRLLAGRVVGVAPVSPDAQRDEIVISKADVERALDQLQGIRPALSANLDRSISTYPITGRRERWVARDHPVLLGRFLPLLTLPVGAGASLLHAHLRGSRRVTAEAGR